MPMVGQRKNKRSFHLMFSMKYRIIKGIKKTEEEDCYE